MPLKDAEEMPNSVNPDQTACLQEQSDLGLQFAQTSLLSVLKLRIMLYYTLVQFHNVYQKFNVVDFIDV